MYAHLIPALLLLTVAPWAARADELPAPPQVESAAPAAAAEELPYGTGYEARQRAAHGGGQTRSREQARGQDRTRTEPGATPREARRETRERWGQHGPTRK
jgi:hypothetical protein